MNKKTISQIETDKITKSFGFLPNGKEVFCYTLMNKNGCKFSVINYGATITSLKIKTQANEKIDVILGFESVEEYTNSFYLPSPPYFGTTVGRTAGRINKAQFELNGKIISLNKNHGIHNLHGGNFGLSTKYWELKSINTNENPSITLQYISPNREENYPGELTVQVCYTLTEENELIVSYYAVASEDTIVNLTQHLYFNLNGHNKTIENLKLQIESKKILETATDLIPTGNFISLRNHPLDFTVTKKCPEMIDTTFVLENKTAAILSSETTNIKMTVSTNQPAVHVYVGGNCFNQITGKENTKYHKTSGICFETQNFPDAPNHLNFPNSILKKGQQYYNQTTFKFENS